ncbi:MAG: BTAD domain-containing putative transcriptional regulator [Kibdelosporangium sp.]
MVVRFGMLGPVQAWQADGRPVALGGPKVRTLLTLLLAAGGKIVSTDRLIDGSYGDDPPENAANALQAQVSRLRRSVGADLVELHPTGYRLAVDPADVDAGRFEALLAEARQAPTAAAAELLDAALALWRGPLPAELDEAEAARLTELRLAATEDRIDALLALGATTGLIARLRSLVAAHPLRERFRAQLIRALAADGQPAEALTVFEDARRVLADELGADPSAELASAHVAVLRGEPVTAAALPAQLTSFIGRADDLLQVATLLDRYRLVTLTGPGGAGKTRLAIEALTGAADVGFVELAKSTDVPQAVLNAMGLREPTRTHTSPPVDRLVAALTGRAMVLLLDNCEHVIDAAAQLAARLLAALPGLRILATSREPLGITGEALYPVPMLPARPAARLFADRAAAVGAGFRSDCVPTGDVDRVCAALDGLPLAIELAAARVRFMPVAQIAARLDDRFGLLSKGSRTAEARHRTLRAVVEWSWDLLDPEERAVAGRLTVFAGGASLEAVQRVCGPADVLAALVDKSLVDVAGPRYRMLETIRAFCAEQLGDQTTATQRAHADYFLEFVAAANDHLLGANQLHWLARLESEQDNLYAALRWAVEADTTLALRLVGALSTYWWLRGRRFDSAQLCLDLALRIGPRPPYTLVEEFALCVVNAVSAIGDGPLRDQLETVQTWAARRSAPPRLPFTTIILAPVVGPPPPDVAVTLIGTDPWSRALEPLGRSYQQVFNGDVAGAEESLSTALARFRALGERWGAMQTLGELAGIRSWRGDHEAAIAMLDEAIDLAGLLGAPDDLADIIARRGECQIRAGDPAGAKESYRRLADLAERWAAPGFMVGAYPGLATIARRDGDLVLARQLCEQALAESGSGWFGPDWTRSQLLIVLGWLECADGRPAEARSWLRSATEDAVRLANFSLAAAAAEALAGVALLDGEPEKSARLLGAATALRGIPLAGDADVARVSAAATALTGVDTYTVAHQEGARLRRDQAVDLMRTSFS